MSRQAIPYRRNVRRGESLTPVGVAALILAALLLGGVAAWVAYQAEDPIAAERAELRRVLHPGPVEGAQLRPLERGAR